MQKLKMASASLVLAIAGTILLFSCKKHHQTSNSNSTTTDTTAFLDVVAGHYNVYDSLGEFIYKMDITHITVDSAPDSLKFENFEGEFTFTVNQWYNQPPIIDVGVHDTLYDTNHKRWKLGGITDAYNNRMHGDTLPLYFQITNINYWLEDATP